jgi:two-component system sensor kinase FixL
MDTLGVTEKGQQLHGRLTQVSRLATIGEMAAGVAHEINQPLTAITTYAQAASRLLDRSEPNLADVREALRQIASQAARAGAIIHRLRNLARHTEGEHRPADINRLVGELMELMETDARMHDVRLRYALAGNLPRVSVDSVQVQHVLLNLLRNALEALAEVPAADREVLIRTSSTAENEVELCMCDTGPGVSSATAERMFDPFFTTKAAGTGLGLSISSTIVGAHNGTLTYEANAPRGACFLIRLPAV